MASACAENTSTAFSSSKACRNYLRARGEYTITAYCATDRLELPPRTRRIRGSGFGCLLAFSCFSEGFLGLLGFTCFGIKLGLQGVGGFFVFLSPGFPSTGVFFPDGYVSCRLICWLGVALIIIAAVVTVFGGFAFTVLGLRGCGIRLGGISRAAAGRDVGGDGPHPRGH